MWWSIPRDIYSDEEDVEIVDGIDTFRGYMNNDLYIRNSSEKCVCDNKFHWSIIPIGFSMDFDEDAADKL
jgi:hypothetical protein